MKYEATVHSETVSQRTRELDIDSQSIDKAEYPALKQVNDKPLSDAELKRLEAFNKLYVHTVLSGKHYVARQRYNAASGGMGTAFESLREFRNYFLSLPKISALQG